VVIAVRDRRVLRTYFEGSDQDPEGVAAIAVPVEDEVTGWLNDATRPPREAGSRVILNPDYFDPTDRYNEDLLTHEITHVATQALTGAGTVAWLVEGIAEQTTYRRESGLARIPKTLLREARTGSVNLPSYDFYSGDVSTHYTTGWLACRLIAAQYGEAKLHAFYRRAADVQSAAQGELTVRDAFEKVLGISMESFQQDLAQDIRAQAAG
jgi:hypothetical protein